VPVILIRFLEQGIDSEIRDGWRGEIDLFLDRGMRYTLKGQVDHGRFHFIHLVKDDPIYRDGFQLRGGLFTVPDGPSRPGPPEVKHGGADPLNIRRVCFLHEAGDPLVVMNKGLKSPF